MLNSNRWDTFSDLNDLVDGYLHRLTLVLLQLTEDRSVQAATELIWTTLSKGRNVFVAGNGGSAATAAHIATDVSLALAGCNDHQDSCGSVRSIVDGVAALTAIGNDYGFERVFARQVEALGRAGDVLLVLSVSGNSPNILLACETAKKREMTVVAFTGRVDGRRPLCDLSIAIDDKSYGRVEDAHLSVGHILANYVRQRHAERISSIPESPA